MYLQRVGLVAIGRNEGERLRQCLDSVVGKVERIVYVDSGSTDGSVELARGRPRMARLCISATRC